MKKDYISSFYQKLSNELKAVISKSYLKETTDGFVVCEKPLDSILRELGMKNSISIDVDAYDDWYLVALINDNEEIIYTMIKMREPGDKQIATGSAIPFISLNWQNCLEAIKLKDLDKLYVELYKVTNRSGLVNTFIRDYFFNPNSMGSYLIADIFVKKILNINFDKNNIWKLDVPFETNDVFARRYLKELSKKGIYNKENNYIQIKDKTSLTKEEYNAILTATTGNIDVYSYAAENQYHAILQRKADKLKNKNSHLFNFSKIIGDNIEKHSLISDAGVGEDPRGFLYESKFKDPKSKLYRIQKELHQK